MMGVDVLPHFNDIEVTLGLGFENTGCFVEHYNVSLAVKEVYNGIGSENA